MWILKFFFKLKNNVLYCKELNLYIFSNKLICFKKLKILKKEKFSFSDKIFSNVRFLKICLYWAYLGQVIKMCLTDIWQWHSSHIGGLSWGELIR